MTTAWRSAFPLDDLEVGACRTFREGAVQVAVFRLDTDTLYAVDNRCPHEGYPLSQGWVKDCVITCPWHNFKFDLRDGACVQGDEAVRVFPVRVRDGGVELDLTPPDPAVERARLWPSLEEGLLEAGMGRVVRDIVRLLGAGVPPEEIAWYCAHFDGRYAEYGTTHATPVAVDALRYLTRYPGAEAALPLAQGYELAARSHVRRPERPLADPVSPLGGLDAVCEELRALVEAEEAERAEALLRGAIARGWGLTDLLPAFFGIVSDHFLSFGHALIYLSKVHALFEARGEADTEPILTGLLKHMVSGTRYDVLPSWRGFRKRLEQLEPELSDLYPTCRDASPDPDRRDTLMTAILDEGGRVMFEAMERAIREGTSVTTLIDAISLAAAERLFRFDVQVDSSNDFQESWLDVTHTQTFANALRFAARNFDAPALLKMLLHGARFVNQARPVDAPADAWLPTQPAASGSVTGTVAAIGRKDAGEAVAQAAAVVEGGEIEALRSALLDLPLADVVTRPIVAGHLIKNTVAAFEEWEAMGHALPILAVVRLLASPVRERRLGRVTHEAIGFVTQGQVPKTLIS